MANVWFVGDGHFGHRNILKFRPRFKTVQEHDDTVVDALNAVCTKRDKIFFLGDWVFDKDALDVIRRIKCPCKHLVLGNHDDYTLLPQMLEVFDHISGDIKYKEFWLSHIPIHPDELRGKCNIYAHTHNAKIEDVSRYFCTSLEQTDYKPVSLADVRAHFELERQKKEAKKARERFNSIWLGD